MAIRHGQDISSGFATWPGWRRPDCASPAMRAAVVARTEQSVLVRGRAGADVQRQVAGVLLARAVHDAVEGEAGAADATPLLKAGMATADRTGRSPRVAQQGCARGADATPARRIGSMNP
jgi:hypothetical protein